MHGTLLCFFFFKQKTTYEMRISDWSSDVCSSDLHREAVVAGKDNPRMTKSLSRRLRGLAERAGSGETRLARLARIGLREMSLVIILCLAAGGRSDEHTSELQSLMRIAHAVFCLQKNNKHKPTHLLHRHTTPTYKTQRQNTNS